MYSLLALPLVSRYEIEVRRRRSHVNLDQVHERSLGCPVHHTTTLTVESEYFVRRLSTSDNKIGQCERKWKHWCGSQDGSMPRSLEFPCTVFLSQESLVPNFDPRLLWLK